jgi:hypothetical protein
MDLLRNLILFVHISAAAVLVGANTGTVRNLRRTKELGRDVFLIAAEDAVLRGKILGICSVMTLMTGVMLILKMGGMAAAPINYHIALGLMLIAVAVSALIMRPTGAKLLILAKSEQFQAKMVPPLTKKLAMGQGILHLLWAIILLLMIFRIYR